MKILQAKNEFVQPHSESGLLRQILNNTATQFNYFSMSHLSERAIKIQNEISVYKRQDTNSRFDWDKETSIENSWGASYLYAALLEKSKLQKYFSVTREELDTLYKEFNQETGRISDLNSLFSRNWLRLVCGKVHIAGTIRHGVLDVEKVIGLANEFSFLSEVQQQFRDKKIGEAEFSYLTEKYEREHKCKLDLVKATEVHWLDTKDNHVSIHSLTNYEPLLKHVDDFLFLKKLYEVLSSREERGVYVSKDVVAALLTIHQIVFPLTPSLDTFLEKEVLIEEKDSYILNFRYSKIAFQGMVHDKAGALLWVNLIRNTEFADDRERIMFWYDRIVSRSHWCDISHAFSLESKLRFLDAATEILLHENDLSAGEKEFQKILLDTGHRLSDLAYVLSPKRNEPKFPSGQDIFNLYKGLKDLDSKWQGELMFEQDSRSALKYFIHQIVRNDFKHKYERVFKLIAFGPEKPFLLWETASTIYYWEPDIIPFLILNKLTASLGSILLLKAKGNDGIFYEKSDIFARVINKNFRLSCDFLASSTELTNEDTARIIFQSLLPIVNEKFVIKGPQLDKQKRHKKESSEIALSFQSIIENTTLPGSYYSGGVSIKKFMYPSLLNGMFDQITAYNPVDYSGHTSIALPFTKMDMLIWLSRLVGKSGADISEKNALNYNICNLFLGAYTAGMNAGYSKRWDYGTEQYVDRLPVWANMQPNLELIDWMYIFLELEREKLLDDFLSRADLRFKIAKDQYDEYNRFISNKLRTHLGILLMGYNGLYNNKSVSAAKNAPVDIALTKLENKITSIITQYCKDEPEKARLDIFSHSLERTFWSTDREELLPVIGDTINKFRKDNKEMIIKELVQTDQLVRSFKLLDYIASENDKTFLLALITENDIEQFFLKSYPNDAEYVLQKLVEEKKFEEKAKQALDIWEKREPRGMQNKKDQHLILCFRMKLLLAYHELDEDKINSIAAPSLQGGIESSKFSAYAEKDFYRALIYLQKNSTEKAYNIFNDQLKSVTEDRPVLGLNRFASKLKWADKTDILVEKKRLFQEAIDEWNSFEATLSKDLDIDYIKDNIWYNKLHAYLALDNNDSFDAEFTGLDKPLQLRPDFLELRIKNLMKRDMQRQAESLLVEAEEYHRLSNGQVPDSIVLLRNLTDTEETHKYLQNIYHRIFSKPPEQLIKILPGNINKFTTLKEFLLNEIVGSATDMLTYINTISDIKLEDKYSDLIMLSLNGRFKNYGWHVTPKRGGSPASGKSGLGLIDFSISSGSERMAICEALQLKGTNRTEVQNHNFKIFNYDPARNLFFIIVYFKRNSDKFIDTWKEYKADISTNVIYPDGFEFIANSLNDISDKFGTNTVMIAKSIHGIDTPIYHVFININYLTPTTKAKSKKTKADTDNLL